MVSDYSLSAKAKLLMASTNQVVRRKLGTRSVTRTLHRHAGRYRTDFVLSALAFLRTNKHYSAITTLKTGILGLGPYVRIDATSNDVGMKGGCHKALSGILMGCMGSGLTSCPSVSPSLVFVARSKVTPRCVRLIGGALRRAVRFSRVRVAGTDYAVSDRYKPGALKVLFRACWKKSTCSRCGADFS